MFSSSDMSPDLGSIKITFQKFYRINGGSTQLKGVTSDVIIPDMYDYLKIREKDNTAALAWDEIAKAKYQSCKDNFQNAVVIKKANEEIANNPTFKLIKENTNWLSKQADEPRSLQLEKYKAYQKQISSTVTQCTNLLKTKTEINFEVVKEDYDKFYNNTDKAKGERYQAWLKALKTDLYINQSLNIVKSMMENQVNKSSVAY
jgi:carboxyl-terminal processing protease